jgi:predicted dehydrogenase
MSEKPTTSRRQFIRRTSVLAASGAALPFAISTSVLAGLRRTGANDRVGIGYIGVGRRAPQLMGLPPEAQIVAVADVNRDRADGVAAAKNCRAYHDYRALLDAPDVDAVVVATPDHWHALPSIHACEAGKDVYCEKPLTLTVHEGRVMVAAARKYGRVVQTGSQQRSTPANDFACRLIREGHLGRVHTIIGHNYPSPWECALPAQAVPDAIDWDAWCGPTAPRPFHSDIYTPRANPGWISFRAYSGGEMTGWGAHGLDQVQCALGTDESGPVEVWTEGGTFEPPIYEAAGSRTRGDTVCGQPHVFFRYAGGEVLTLADGPAGGAEFIGEHGKISVDRGSFSVDPPDLADAIEQPSPVSDDPTVIHLQNWIDCIKSRARPVADVEVGHRSATVCHLGNIARWVGRRLRWDPAREAFRDDAEANALLRRERRAPYELPNPV